MVEFNKKRSQFKLRHMDIEFFCTRKNGNPVRKSKLPNHRIHFFRPEMPGILRNWIEFVLDSSKNKSVGRADIECQCSDKLLASARASDVSTKLETSLQILPDRNSQFVRFKLQGFIFSV